MKIKLLIAAAIIITSSACNRKDNMETTSSGLQYKFHVKKNQPPPTRGDVMNVEMVALTPYDSVFYDTRTFDAPLRLVLENPSYSGSLEEGFSMMGPGDSATFKILADSFFEKSARVQFPPFLNTGDYITFHVKMKNWQKKEDFEAELKTETETKATEEREQLNKYLSENNITIEPNPSGLIFIPQTQGRGAMAAAGDTVTVHYTGRLINGQVFDSSVDRGDPLVFPLGQQLVISGWEEGLALMRKGEKATLIIPSDIAYGARGYSPGIPPFSTLIFDVELVDIKKK